MNTDKSPQYLISQTGYKGVYPPFHNPNEFEWVKKVEEQWESIRDELFANAQFHTMNGPQIIGEKGWKAIYLINFSWIKHNTCDKFPITMHVLKSVPDLTFVAFSMLEPGASLQPHFGDTNTVIRCHLGIEVPDTAPVCALKVAEEVKGWQNGKIIMFSECHLHSAWNNSNKRRIVLSFDSLRPEFATQKNTICARVLAAETLFFLSNFKWFSFFSKYLYKPIYWSAVAAWYIYLPLQKRVSFLP